MLFLDKIPRTVHMCDRFSMINSGELRLPYLIINLLRVFQIIITKNILKKLMFKRPLRIFLNSLKIKDINNWVFKKTQPYSSKYLAERESN